LDRLREAGFDVVLCTPGRQPDETELLELLPGCVGYLAGVERVSATVLETAEALRVISRNGVGVDNVDMASAKRLGIKVLTTPGAQSRAVAELTVGLLFALARRIPAADQAIKAGNWVRVEGMELKGKQLGLIGCGRVGQVVATLGAGIGMRVVANDVDRDATFSPGGGFAYVSLPELLENSDAVSLHCPAVPDAKPMLDQAAFARMKKGAILINTARASLVDEEALLAALENGRLGGYATDVFPEEPPCDLRVARHPRVIASPHVGALTAETVGRAMEHAVTNLLKALTGEGAAEMALGD
jgi:phosphoglycerate dehydrogenase-like enzyme